MIRNEDARELFKNKGLSYDCIDTDSLMKLWTIISDKLKVDNPIGTVVMSMPIDRSNKKDFKFNKNGKFIEGYLYCNSHYFDRREAVSFNKNGFIGFAGWACNNSVRAFVEGFMEWCEYMEKEKLNHEQALHNQSAKVNMS